MGFSPTVSGGSSTSKSYGPLLIATRGNYGNYTMSDGSKPSETYRISHVATNTISNIQLMYQNSYGTGDSPGTNNVTVKSSIEYNGTLFPAQFGGKSSAVIPPGGTLLTDPIEVDIPAGSTFYTRNYVSAAPIDNPISAPILSGTGSGSPLVAGTYYVTYTWTNAQGESKTSTESSITITAGQYISVTVPDYPIGATGANIYIGTASGAETKQGSTSILTYTQSAALSSGSSMPTSNTTSAGKYPLGIACNLTNEGTSIGDATAGGTITNGTSWAWGPIALVGTSATPKPAILLIGDSIMAGTGDSGYNQGWGVRAMGTTMPFTVLAMSGERADQFIGTGRQMRMKTAAYATHAIVEYGINDLNVADSLSTIQNNLKNIWNSLSQRGIKVYQSTITPHTSSTDNWATTTNQTAFSAESIRQQLNTWIRSLPAPLTGYLEVSHVVESTPGTGIWNPSYVYLDGNGIHPNASGHQQIASTINAASIFTL